MSNFSPFVPWIIGGCIIATILWFTFWRRSSSAFSAPILETYSHDLTEEARQGRLDPVIGRDQEIDRLIRILCRRRKNNPLLIGDAGVGKTAVVEGLALRTTQGQVPNSLKEKRVLALDFAALVSGTKFRGDLEERLRRLTQELEHLNRSVVLFIDELHIIGQAGGSEGAISVADILKPALARGTLQAIGATTWAEYERDVQTDQALERRFQPLLIGEPSLKEALEILHGIKGCYEEFHGVKISEEALEEAVRGSRKVKDRRLPDKAIDLIDEACAKLAIETTVHHRLAPGLLHGASASAKQRSQESRPTVSGNDIKSILADWTKNSYVS